MLYGLLSATAARLPDHPAVVEQGAATAYGELLQRVDRLAQTLAERGVSQGDRVAMLLPNGRDFVVGVFAVARLGAVVVPLNIGFKEDELRYYFSDSRPRAVLCGPSMASVCGRLSADLGLDCTTVPLEGGTAVGEAPTSGGPASGPALMQYSSGSTGTPKRVVRTQENLVHEARSFHATVGYTARDRVLTVVPLYHSHGFGNCMLGSIAAGATMYTLRAFARQRVLEVLTTQGISVFPGVPFMFSILADSPSAEARPLPSLRLAFSAGAPLEQATYARFQERFGVPVRQLYGSTETGAIAINVGALEGEGWASVGRPLHGVDVRLVDESGADVGPGEPGEVLVRTEAMTAGYGADPELSGKSFRDGFFWTGDLAHQDAAGNLSISGRKTSFINVGGNKVDPGQVETVIQSHPAVHEVVVVGVKGSYGQEIIKAVVVPKANLAAQAALDPQAVREWCQGKLADFKIPRVVEFRGEIPRSPLGKILRKYLQGELLADEGPQPSS